MTNAVTRRAAMLGAAATSGSLLLAGGNAGAQTKPTELRVGITTFLSGPASVFGVPAQADGRDAVRGDQQGRRHRRRPGAGLFVDEAPAPTIWSANTAASCRTRACISSSPSISSGSCLACTPLRDEMKKTTLLWDCGTQRIFEEGTAPLRLPHPGLRHAGSPRPAAVPAEEQAGLPDAGGDQPGLCLGARQLGDVEGRHGCAEARRARGGGDVPPPRRHRLQHGSHPAAGDAARRDPLHQLGRRPRHLRPPGLGAEAVRAFDLRPAGGRGLDADPRQEHGRRPCHRHPRRPLEQPSRSRRTRRGWRSSSMATGRSSTNTRSTPATTWPRRSPPCRPASPRRSRPRAAAGRTTRNSPTPSAA